MAAKAGREWAGQQGISDATQGLNFNVHDPTWEDSIEREYSLLIPDRQVLVQTPKAGRTRRSGVVVGCLK